MKPQTPPTAATAGSARRAADWLAARRRLAIACVAVFVAFNILSHDAVQAIAGWLGEQLTIERLSAYVTVGGGLGLLLVGALLWRPLRAHPAGRDLAIWGAVTVALVAATYNTLFMVNTEAIHFPQYALLGVLIYPLAGRFAETILWVTLFGALDEAWQYWVLSNGAEFVYFDFNDIVLNLLGGATGAIVAAALIGPPREPGASGETMGYRWRDFVRSPPFVVAAGITLLGVLLYAAGVVTMYANPDSWIVLRRKGPPVAYWVTSYWGKTGHELMPLDGLLLCAILVGLYLALDLRLERSAGSSS